MNKSHLSYRRQYGAINGSDLTHALLKSGVPPGSLLEPIMFTIHINDLNHAV